MTKLLLFAAAALTAAAYSFQQPVPLTLSRQGLGTVSVASADFNRDGIADIAGANLGTPPLAGGQISTIGILLGTRGGLPSNLNELPLEGNVLELVAADITNDSHADLIALTITPTGAKLCAYAGTGFGGFGSPVCSPVAGSPTRLVIADIDKDGRPDAVMLRIVDSLVVTMRNTGGGAFVAGPTANVAAPTALALADWNGDAIPDAAVVTRTGSLFLLLSSADGAFKSIQTLSASVAVSDIVAVDLNRDQRPDILMTDPQAATVSYSLGRSDAARYLGPLTTLPFAARGTHLRTADLNGDLFAEVIAATGAGMLIISGNTDGSINVPAPPGVPPIGALTFAAGDFDGDSRPDLLAGTTLLLGQSTPTVTTLEVTPASSTYGQRVQITARISSAASTPAAVPLAGARIELLDGTTLLQTLQAAPLASGTQELANARVELVLPAGSRDLTARFAGTPAFNGSTTQPVRITVAPAASTVRFQAPPAEVSYTQGLRTNAVVSSALAPAIEGVVRLAVNGAVVAQGLVNAGVSQLLIPAGSPLGKIRVRLTYEGTNLLPSSSEEVEYQVKGGIVTAASAASYRPGLAPDSLAILAVPGLVRSAGSIASSLPWPISLGGVEVETRDETGANRIRAGLTFAGTGQVNVHLPAATPIGPGRVVVFVDGVEAATGDIQITPTAPGLFTANGAGTGVVAAYAALYAGDGTISPRNVFNCAGGQCTALPLDLGAPSDSLVLTLFGTGWRGAASTVVTIDGRSAHVLYAGGQPETPGLDQANIIVPRELAGRGEVDIVVIADGVATNGGRIAIR